MWWASGADGPCSPSSGICDSQPGERFGDTRFNVHQIRWAYFVVMQHAVKVRQASTGLEFLALVPFHSMTTQTLIRGGGGATLELDGYVTLRATHAADIGAPVTLFPGNMTDAEYFLRYLRLPHEPNPHRQLKLTLPGALPRGSKFIYCMKGTAEERRRDECKGAYRSDSMFWKSKVLIFCSVC
jgi:hypothetical protein